VGEDESDVRDSGPEPFHKKLVRASGAALDELTGIEVGGKDFCASSMSKKLVVFSNKAVMLSLIVVTGADVDIKFSKAVVVGVFVQAGENAVIPATPVVAPFNKASRSISQKSC
jgi:hypothetical protein